MEEKCCKNCRRHDDFTWVCFNGVSEYCADFRCLDDSCECWEGVNNENSCSDTSEKCIRWRNDS